MCNLYGVWEIAAMRRDGSQYSWTDLGVDGLNLLAIN